MLKHLWGMWGSVGEMLAAVKHLVAPVYTEAAASKQAQGGVGANTLFSEKPSFGIPLWTGPFVIA